MALSVFPSVGLVFAKTKDDFANIIFKKCFYCGCEPSNSDKNFRTGEITKYNGVDRVDNLKGYVLNNCVPCCEKCNNDNYSILQVHHIIERCNGGTDEESNLLLLCPNCHMTEHLGYSKWKESGWSRTPP